MYLAMVETNSNQSYIFSTQRQRDHIGASWLISQVPKWFDEFCEEHKKKEVFTKVSGKVVATFESKKEAHEFVRWMTLKALKEAPGLDLSGAYQKIKTSEITDADLYTLRMRVEDYNARRVPPNARFPVNPFSIVCDESKMAASPKQFENDERSPLADQTLSEPVQHKRKHAQQAREHILNIIRDKLNDNINEIIFGSENEKYNISKDDAVSLVPNLYQLERFFNANNEEKRINDDINEDDDVAKLNWVGIIHADANNLGSIFTQPEAILEKFDDIELFDQYASNIGKFLNDVSDAVEEATEKAFVSAWISVYQAMCAKSKQNNKEYPNVIPLVPILLGGDDVIVVSDGRYSMTFAVEYLRCFEKFTAEYPILRQLARAARAQKIGHKDNEAMGMSAAAGVAIVKTPFPFYDAYRMASSLCDNAKDKTREFSTVNFHVHYDASSIDIETALKQYATITARPYVVTDIESDDEQLLKWETVVNAAIEIRGSGKNDGLPRNQQAALRQVLHDDQVTAINRWKLLKNRGYSPTLAALEGEDPAIGPYLWNNNGVYAGSLLLDVMQLNDIIPAEALILDAERRYKGGDIYGN